MLYSSRSDIDTTKAQGQDTTRNANAVYSHCEKVSPSINNGCVSRVLNTLNL